jgi:hypothetical protein
MLVRATFKHGGEQMHAGLVPFERNDVVVFTDENYLPDDADALMDIYLPQGLPVDSLLPVIVWTHGGGWACGPWHLPVEDGPAETHGPDPDWEAEGGPEARDRAVGGCSGRYT